MNMFRCIRSCCFLKNNYRRITGRGLHRSLVLPVILSNSRASYSSEPEGKATACEDEPEISRGDYLIYSSHTGKYWHRILSTKMDGINWEDAFNDVLIPKEQNVNVEAVIMLICRRRKLYNTAASFFKFLWEKKEVTPGLLYLFCEIMLDSTEELRDCEEIIFTIFQNVLDRDKISARACSNVLLHSPTYWKSILWCFKNSLMDGGNHSSAVLSLLEMNKISEALELYGQNNVRNPQVENMFVKCFTKEAEKGVQAVLPQIQKFLNHILNVTKDIIIHDETINLLQDLFVKLRTVDKNFIWIVHKGITTSKVCHLCKGKLISTDVSEEEIEKLLEDLKKNVIYQESIFLKSNHEEWNNFCNFLDGQNYNIVVDGLNVLCSLKSYTKFEELIQKISSHGLNPFILARSHFRTLPEFKFIKKHYPYFLTENLSDDDVFILYAALKKGKGCYTLSNDRMKFCNSLLSTPETGNIYKRWQATHQCKLAYNKYILFPVGVSNGLQKCPDCEEGEFRFHYVASQSIHPPILICVSRLRRQNNYKLFRC